MNLKSGENLRKKEKSQLIGPSFLFFPFPNFRSDKIGFFFAGRSTFNSERNMFIPRKKKKKKTTK